MHEGIDKIRQKLGTTRTGKSLDKALKLFTDPSSGVRKSPHIAQVNQCVAREFEAFECRLLLSCPTVTRMTIRCRLPRVSGRQVRSCAVAKVNQLSTYLGVKVMVLGIGSHINMDELVQISGDEQFAFNNLTQTETISQFLTSFKKFSVGERCEYSRGVNGADIRCRPNSIEVNVSLEKPLKGHMYVMDHFGDSECVVRSNSTEVSLNMDLGDCGISRQFSVVVAML